MNTTIKTKGSPEAQTVMVYEGKAPVIQEPKILGIAGTLDAPYRWIEKRLETIQQLKAHVIVNRNNLSISLKLEDKDAFGDTITGKACFHPVFLIFGVNSGRYQTTYELAQLFKMNRSHFENQSIAMKLVTELQNFKAKVDSEIEKTFNNRGDKRDLTAQVVNSNVPEKFNLTIPIFKGQPKQKIEIEIYINPADLTCALVSPEANDMTEAYRDTMIEEVLKKIETAAPQIVIIEE
ncbi:MAG: hypothetical protein NTZ69_15830 [Bacteroidia bacterium]|nr:hypothetical protein [Bacteroidia bacterium]